MDYSEFLKKWQARHETHLSRKRDHGKRTFLTRKERMRAILKRPIREINDKPLNDLLTILNALDDQRAERSSVQKMCHNEYIKTSLPVIVGQAEFAKNRMYYLKRMKAKIQTTNVFVEAPRRFGKTWALSMFVAAVLLAVPNVTVTIIAQNERQAKALLGFVRECVLSLDGTEERVKRPYSTQHLTVFGDDKRDVRVAAAFPCSENVRGYRTCSCGALVCMHVLVCSCVCFRLRPIRLEEQCLSTIYHRHLRILMFG